MKKCYTNMCQQNNSWTSETQRCAHTGPAFTKDTYNITRGNYNTLQDSHLDFFNQLLGKTRVITDAGEMESYNVDFLKHLRGNSSVVLKPKTTEEVSKILAFCNGNRLAVCPQGGNTGMVGASVPVFDEIIVTAELMNNIMNFNENSGILVCESGCILQNLNNYIDEKNYIMPIDLGSKGSCHIGGNVATNAGGLNLLRYGSLHGNILGLEVVKADGEILDCLSALQKDNTGYHLKNLFIGSEGTLGFITKVAIQCPIKPKSISLAFLGLQSYEKVLKTFKLAKHDLGEILSAMEVMDTPTMQLVNQHLGLKSPIGDYPFYLIIETSGSNETHDLEKLHNFLELTLKKHFVLNGTIAAEPSKRQAIWDIRENIAGCLIKEGHVFLYDLSVPLDEYYTLVAEMREHVSDKALRVFGFGHLGDGNLHLQVSVEKYSSEMQHFIESYLYERVAKLNGSISAEHGIGLLKTKSLHFTKTKESIKLMREIKTLMDPKGILNPYKVLPLVD